MLSDTIHLPLVLDWMDRLDEKGKPVPFSITFCTYSATTKTGGERITIDNAIKVIGKRNGNIIQSKPASEKAAPKNPNHFRNQTRNIMVPGSNQIRKVRIRLIECFNGKKVIW
jgi:hypothetical protein